MKYKIPPVILLFSLCHALVQGGDQTWNTPTSFDPDFPDLYNWKEADGVLTVESNADVFANATLELRSTTKIIFKPGWRAYTTANVRAGIDSNLDGFTESDVDGDGIPDHYEDKVAALNKFDPSDALQINPDNGLTYYDHYHLNIGHRFISTGSKKFRAPFLNDLIMDFNIDDNGVIDTTINEYFGHYDGDGIMDFWAEVTQYDPSWSTPFYYNAYAGFNSYIPFNYRVMDGWGGALSTIIGGSPWGFSAFHWSPFVSDYVRYDVVRYGKPSTLWEGGSYPANYGLGPDVGGDEIIPVSAELLSFSGGQWSYKLVMPSAQVGAYYTPILLKNGVWIQVGPVKVGFGTNLTWTLSIGNSEINQPVLVAAFRKSERPKIIFEPINNSTMPVRNPSGIGPGKSAVFEISVEPGPPEFPDSKITWAVASGSTGSVSFPSGNTGRVVTVSHQVPGDVVLEVTILDQSDNPITPKPRINLRLYGLNNTVDIHARGIRTPTQQESITLAERDAFIAKANEIYKQLGISFNLASWGWIENDLFYEIESVNRFHQMTGTMKNTGGIEVYFVNSSTIGAGRNQSSTNDKYEGIMVAVQNAATSTLAHEIGHIFGWEDVYPMYFTENPSENFIHPDKIPYDWNNGDAPPRYYDPDIRYTDLLKRMLMYGHTNENKGDIPFGDVYASDGNVSNAATFVKTGLLHVGDRQPEHW